MHLLHEIWNEHFDKYPDGYFLQYSHSRGSDDARNAALMYPEHKRIKIQGILMRMILSNLAHQNALQQSSKKVLMSTQPQTDRVKDTMDAPENRSGLSDALPLFQSAIPAGFPSPADDAIEQELDLNKHLIKHPAATFFLRVKGNSMEKAGVHDGDIVIVDRSLAPADGKIVIASVDGELTIKRLSHTHRGIFLVAENEGYSPIAVTPDNDLRFWGVVTTVIHSL